MNEVSLSWRKFVHRYKNIRKKERAAKKTIGRSEDVEDYLRSHFCMKPFERLETTDEGFLYVCCEDWLPTPIGTMGKDFYDQWHGRKANNIRRSIADGSFRYCSRKHCSDITNRTLIAKTDHRAVQAIRELDSGVVSAPKVIALSHDRSCNLSCPSCRTKMIVANKEEQAKLDVDFERDALPLLKQSERVYITGSGDPFASNHFRRIIKRLNRLEFGHLKFDLHTNGLLFNERAWRELDLEGRVNAVEISIDAATPETYAVVRRGGEFNILLANLEFVERLRRSGQIKELIFSMVVQTRNFTEVPDFALLGQKYAADVIAFQMIRNWGTFNDEEFQRELIGDRAHPQHKEFLEILQRPELKDSRVHAGNILGYA